MDEHAAADRGILGYVITWRGRPQTVARGGTLFEPSRGYQLYRTVKEVKEAIARHYRIRDAGRLPSQQGQVRFIAIRWAASRYPKEGT